MSQRRILRVDEGTREVTEIPFGARLGAMAVDEETGSVWVDAA